MVPRKRYCLQEICHWIASDKFSLKKSFLKYDKYYKVLGIAQKKKEKREKLGNE